MATDTDMLARKFSVVLRDWLSPSNMAIVIERNLDSRWAGFCASHDFCDANEAMLLAFSSLTGRDMEGDDTDDINKAWGIARASNFAAE